ncbi:hypothetical protein J6590_107860, partial [Homalodisca vitripennis]
NTTGEYQAHNPGSGWYQITSDENNAFAGVEHNEKISISSMTSYDLRTETLKESIRRTIQVQ